VNVYAAVFDYHWLSFKEISNSKSNRLSFELPLKMVFSIDGVN
jgi:hypothetical protein